MIARVVLVGNLVRDPEIRVTQSELSICNFSVAVNQREKVNGQWVDYPSYFRCVAFGKTAEFIGRYFTKGTGIALDGRLRQDRWEDKETKAKRSEVKVMVDNAQSTARKGEGEQGGGQRSDPVAAAQGEFNVPQADFGVPDADFSGGDDDIPF